MSMQFWGVEVKSKVPSKVEFEFGTVIHLSQATLSDVKKDAEPVVLRVKVEDKEHVLGILSPSTPQLTFDLVFDTEFEISHNFKNGSVHFLGYQSEMQISDDDMMSDDDDESGEDVPVLQQENGVAAVAAPKPKAAAKAAAKATAKPSKDALPEADSDEDDSDDDSSDEDMGTPMTSEYTSDSDDDDEDDDDDDESDEDVKPAKAPAKVESGKKRPNADAKTPESKKAKLVTPQKTDGKKGGAQVHTATPHPGKKGGKTSGDKSTPKSGGSVSCNSCTKTFNSEVGLQSHIKAKHSAK